MWRKKRKNQNKSVKKIIDFDKKGGVGCIQ